LKINPRTNLFFGILFTCILGTLLHFTYEWSGENPFIGLFSAVNESVWEHLKLLFSPALLYTLFEIIVLSKTSERFLTTRILGILLGMFFIVSAFFTYTGITGKSFPVLDISIFILGVLITFLLSRYLEVQAPGLSLPLPVIYILLFFLILLFFSFTFHPPKLPLFQEPAFAEAFHHILLELFTRN